MEELVVELLTLSAKYQEQHDKEADFWDCDCDLCMELEQIERRWLELLKQIKSNLQAKKERSRSNYLP